MKDNLKYYLMFLWFFAQLINDEHYNLSQLILKKTDFPTSWKSKASCENKRNYYTIPLVI